MKRAWLSVVLFALGCGGAAEPATTTTTPTVTHVDVVIATTNGYRVEGTSVWEGRYDCTQGITGLTLELVGSGTGDSSVAATFHFYAVPENPDVPSGRYTLVGTVRGDGTIDLVPNAWIEQPYGYVMVGMTGFLDRATGIMRGAITNPGCTAFDLERVR